MSDLNLLIEIEDLKRQNKKLLSILDEIVESSDSDVLRAIVQTKIHEMINEENDEY